MPEPTLHTQTIPKIHIPTSLRETSDLPTSIIAEAITHLHRSGVLILSNAISPTHLSTLSNTLLPEALTTASLPNHHFNFGPQTRNMDQAPPLDPSLMYADVWANPSAVAILTALFGPSPRCHYANGNTALQATGRQPVHSDVAGPHPLYPFAYAINIPLDDVGVVNGGTEVWVGSHRDSNVTQHVSGGDGEAKLQIKPELVEARRVHSPPVQVCTTKGDLILRDLRLWHAGMPNTTAVPRIMLAFVVQPSWFEGPSKVLLPLKAKDVVEGWRRDTGLEYAAEWVDGDVDHRTIRSTGVDFGTGNKALLEMGDEYWRPGY